MGTPKAALGNPDYYVIKGRMGGRPTWQETLARQRHAKKRKGEMRLHPRASAGGLLTSTFPHGGNWDPALTVILCQTEA